MNIENRNLERVVRTINPEYSLLEASRLKGGVSANVTLLKVATPDGREKKMIARLFGDEGVEDNPQAASKEFKLLQALLQSGVRVQSPVCFDESREVLPSPYLVLEYVEGSTEFSPEDLTSFLSQMATGLSQIHETDHKKLDLSFLPTFEGVSAEVMENPPEKMDDSLDEGRIRSELEKVWPLPARNEQTLLHGDYWPGNLIWRKNEVAAFIDWEDAMIGDPIVDLAISRLELMMGPFDINAMNTFTEQYQAAREIDLTDLPYWDLYAALRPAHKISDWAESQADEKGMREGVQQFIEQAFEKIDAF